jgi:hypothetical protein
MYAKVSWYPGEGNAVVPFCTMVEWDQDFSSDVYDKLTKHAGGGLPDGCLCRIVGSGQGGPKVIEVWQTPGDAQRWAEATSPDISDMSMPPPDRVSAFETSAYVVAPA